MIIIADSGSTKTNWVLIKEEEISRRVQTKGINPFFRESGDIFSELENQLLPEVSEKVEAVHFYGAGIINESKGAGIFQLLQDLFQEAKIHIYSDLVAAAHATGGNQKGIVCILGTGSNSCLYDGENIVDHVSPLGYILGDEGSGAVLGKKLIGDYLKKVMPEHLRICFKKQFTFSSSEFLEKVYHESKPNLFLAGFTRFIYENIDDEYCVKFVRNEFQLFVERNLFNYEGYKSLPIHFVGSVAFYFQQFLREVLNNNSLIVGKIIQDPMDELIKYHLKKIK